ncbi:hypothetical protein [Streptomyces sp. NPDC102462]|uniref:hypothetical protein n=1 Tax=Streptomyces sp. NPDC102462 TaxID=3366178 RepID=UPI0037F2971E
MSWPERSVPAEAHLHPHQAGHVAAVQGPAVRAEDTVREGHGQGGGREAGGLLDADLSAQRRRHLLAGRGDAHAGERELFQPETYGPGQTRLGEVVRRQFHLAAEAHGLLELAPPLGLLLVAGGEADGAGEADRRLPVGGGPLGRQVHDRLPVRAQRGVQRVVRGDLLGPRMQCARPLQVVGKPAQQHVPLGAGLGDALQDIVAGFLQRVAHQIGMGGELLVQPTAPQPRAYEWEPDAQPLEPLFLDGVVVDRHQQVPALGLMAGRRHQRPFQLTAAPGGHAAGERLRLVEAYTRCNRLACTDAPPHPREPRSTVERR